MILKCSKGEEESRKQKRPKERKKKKLPAATPCPCPTAANCMPCRLQARWRKANKRDECEKEEHKRELPTSRLYFSRYYRYELLSPHTLRLTSHPKSAQNIRLIERGKPRSKSCVRIHLRESRLNEKNIKFFLNLCLLCKYSSESYCSQFNLSF